MGLFSFTQEIAMDLGTANTIIITNGKIVVDEPSDRKSTRLNSSHSTSSRMPSSA